MPPARILIADDNQDNITHVEHFLKFKEYEVHVAHNGKQAMEMALELSPHVILMDVQMPVMSGLEAMQKLREIEDTKSIKLIALTARASEKDRTACLEAGADAYLSKPFRLKELAKLIEELLGTTTEDERN